LAAPHLETLQVPGHEDQVTYLAAVIAGADELAAGAFVGWLTRSTAQEILAQHGFVAP